VTGAALILFFAFVALTASPQTDIKIFATGLAIGILLDATVVRALLVPSLMTILGRWNWWLPRWAATLLRTEPSSPAREPAFAGANGSSPAPPAATEPERERESVG
jgi:RND superfamily putative drug exporter